MPFPRDNIRHHITGHIRLAPTHGATEMPFWRTSLEDAVSVQAVTQMEVLLDYLSSIQAREFGPFRGISAQTIAAAGKPLFERHCVTCHGPNGHGPNPPQYTVGVSMDLTTIASRHAGAFELRRVYESIARCGDDWGKTAMPSWNEVMTRAGWGEIPHDEEHRSDGDLHRIDPALTHRSPPNRDGQSHGCGAHVLTTSAHRL